MVATRWSRRFADVRASIDRRECRGGAGAAVAVRSEEERCMRRKMRSGRRWQLTTSDEQVVDIPPLDRTGAAEVFGARRRRRLRSSTPAGSSGQHDDSADPVAVRRTEAVDIRAASADSAVCGAGTDSRSRPSIRNPFDQTPAAAGIRPNGRRRPHPTQSWQNQRDRCRTLRFSRRRRIERAESDLPIVSLCSGIVCALLLHLATHRTRRVIMGFMARRRRTRSAELWRRGAGDGRV